MKLLLDTHVWIWTVLHPEKVGRSVRRHLGNPKNEIYLSPISVWEAHHLHRRKKLRLSSSFTDWLDQALVRFPLLEAPFNFAVAAETSRIQLPQSDLGDIFLAATASALGLTLVTADAQLIECSWLTTLAND